MCICLKLQIFDHYPPLFVPVLLTRTPTSTYVDFSESPHYLKTFAAHEFLYKNQERQVGKEVISL